MSASAFSAFPFPSQAEHGFQRGERFILSRSLQGKDTQAEFSLILRIRQVQPQRVATTFHSRVIVIRPKCVFRKGFGKTVISRKVCSFEIGSSQLHRSYKRAMVTKNNNPLSIKGWMCSPQAVLRFGRLQRVLRGPVSRRAVSGYSFLSFCLPPRSFSVFLPRVTFTLTA